MKPPPATHQPPEGDRNRPHHTALLLIGLMLLTLAPRAVLGYRRAVLNSDAVFFVETAMAFDRGDTSEGLEKLGLNVYPFLLSGLHRAGLSWEAAGESSSLAFSMLTVLPLFGSGVATIWPSRGHLRLFALGVSCRSDRVGPGDDPRRAFLVRDEPLVLVIA